MHGLQQIIRINVDAYNKAIAAPNPAKAVANQLEKERRHKAVGKALAEHKSRRSGSSGGDI